MKNLKKSQSRKVKQHEEMKYEKDRTAQTGKK